MKFTGFIKRSVLSAALSTLAILIMAQSPQMVSYQAVVRDASSQPQVNTGVNLTLSINQGSASGTLVYTETHNTTTNDYGMLTVFLGTGTTSYDFSAINWANSPYFMNINIDGKDMDPVQLVSVPYAIYSDEAGNVFSGNYNDLVNKPTLNINNWDAAYDWGDHSTMGYLDSKWEKTGDYIYPDNYRVSIGSSSSRQGMLTIAGDPMALDTDTLFQVLNNDNFPVFTILNNGSVNINVLEDAAKGAKGGFAIGGFERVKGKVQPYLFIDPDSTRLYFNESTGKAAKGGFAIGGFERSKSTGSMGKFVEIRGNRAGAGNSVFLGYMAGGENGYTSSNNVAIGNMAGKDLNLSAENNIFIGSEAGLTNSGYDENIYIGTGAGKNCSAGYNNVYIGHLSGSEGHGQYNIFIGDEAGRKNDGGYSNVFIGEKAGTNVIDGGRNTFIGTQAGQNMVGGKENTFLGTSAGLASQSGDANTYLGYSAGTGNTSGSNNTFIGHGTGYMTEGSNNVFIGSTVGLSVESSNYQLLIDCFSHADPSDSFINGIMSGSKKLRFNAPTGINKDPEIGYDLDVVGMIRSENITTKSDIRFKTNIKTISNALNRVLALRGVTFNWIRENGVDDRRSMGLIAQEAEEIIPELVIKDNDYYSITYPQVSALLIEAVKELKKENDSLREELSRVDKLERKLDELSKKLSEK